MKVAPFTLTSLLAVFLAGFLAGCAAPAPKPGPVLPAKPHVTFWNGEGAHGPSKIVVALGEQRAYFFRDHKLVGETPVSSGRKGFDTPAGVYRVIQKDEKHVSTLYGDFVSLDGEVLKTNVDISKEPPPEGLVFAGASMPFFLRFAAGYGLHAGRLPGHRASHGCIRLPRTMAEHFFRNAEVGTPVVVQEEPLQATL